MNKPVAWITPDNLKILENEYGEEVLVRNQDHYTYEIPLYTHPVKENYMDEILNNTLNMERNHNEKAYKELYDFCVKQQAEIEVLKKKIVSLEFLARKEK